MVVARVLLPVMCNVNEYIKRGEHVLSTECNLCQTCVPVCAKDALKLSFGFDLGGKELLRERDRAEKQMMAPGVPER